MFCWVYSKLSCLVNLSNSNNELSENAFNTFFGFFVSNTIQIYKTNLNKLKNTKTCPVFYLMIMLLIVSAFLDRPILLNGNKGVYVLKCHSRTTLKWNKACVVELLVDSEWKVWLL